MEIQKILARKERSDLQQSLPKGSERGRTKLGKARLKTFHFQHPYITGSDNL